MIVGGHYLDVLLACHGICLLTDHTVSQQMRMNPQHKSGFMCGLAVIIWEMPCCCTSPTDESDAKEVRAQMLITNAHDQLQKCI